MPQMETYCTECEQTASATTPHCPNCGAEDAWDERPAYRFNEDDLPYLFSHEFYNDTYGLWRSFVGSYFGVYELNGSDIAKIPEGFPKMKYCVVELYYVITENYELEGPFLDRKKAREHME